MKLTRQKPPWYAAGLAFECVGCGNCCAGPHEGYVWVGQADIAAIAKHLGKSEPEMRDCYLRNVRGRYSLIEYQDTKDCVFLVPDGRGGRTCAIYQVRPLQCRTWPFWKSNLRSPDSWACAGRRCPGINRGRLFSCDEIEARANTTIE
ncbi:MAG TPA: YkgJ family cysteine cluster protein [Phycisphaerae bacterium]|nr:YkgJ family cysteine cluster protein [Phycisphaerae bacterium]